MHSRVNKPKTIWVLRKKKLLICPSIHQLAICTKCGLELDKYGVKLFIKSANITGNCVEVGKCYQQAKLYCGLLLEAENWTVSPVISRYMLDNLYSLSVCQKERFTF